MGEILSIVWLDHYGNALDITRNILEPNPTIGWRQRASLDTTFLKSPLKTNEWGWRTSPVSNFNKYDKRVLILGPSSTFGWGVQESDTYASKLQRLLSDSTSTVVINAGEIGYSTFQGERLLSSGEVRSVHPSVIVFAYGVNDLDRSRFFYQSSKTDAEQFSDSSTSSLEHGALFDRLRSDAFMDILLKTSGALHDLLDPPKISVSPREDVIPGTRVPIEDFTTNITRMIVEGRQYGAKILFLTTATNLPRSELSESAVTAMEADYSAATSQWRAGNIQDAKEVLQRILNTDPNQAAAHYFLSAIATNEGNNSLAHEEFEKARQAEPYRISSDVRIYNDALKRIASEYNIPVGDIDTWMNGHDRSSLFVDPIHFSPAGNALIANGIFRIIEDAKMLNQP